MSEHGPDEHLDAQVERLEERNEALGEQIDETRSDWEAKKADPKVPGAAGDPVAAEGNLPPEAGEGAGDVRQATPGVDAGQGGAARDDSDARDGVGGPRRGGAQAGRSATGDFTPDDLDGEDPPGRRA